MDALLEEFDRAWKEKTPESRAHAKEVAEEYVAAKTEALDADIREAVRAYREAHLDDPVTREDLVRLVGAYRAQGDEECRLMVDAVLLAQHEPQTITGSVAMVPPLKGA